jgi:hypothetical protein
MNIIEESEMFVATCGHKVDDAITCSVDDGQISSDGSRAITYGSYCGKCFFEYFLEGRIENSEMNGFTERVINWVENPR